MATALQIKSLIRNFFEEDKEKFVTSALQIAASEAYKGHSDFARELKNIIDKGRQAIGRVVAFPAGLHELIEEEKTFEKLPELIVQDTIRKRLLRIIQEYFQQDRLMAHGLPFRRKILLAGPPGTGKTMTARILASELQLPYYSIQMDRLITRFMGESSSKLRQVFEVIQAHQGVYMFDEFDAIGADRGKDNDVGEMRRVLNSFLQFLEKDQSNSLILASTNNLKLLDKALFRRFDDYLPYQLPEPEEIKQLIINRLGTFKPKGKLDSVFTEALDLSHAEISLACFDSLKEAILNEQKKVEPLALQEAIKLRKHIYNH